MFNSGCVQYARLTSITGSIRKSITRPKATSRISPIDLDHPLRLRLTNHATSPSPVASLGEKSRHIRDDCFGDGLGICSHLISHDY